MLEDVLILVKGRAKLDVCDVDANSEWLRKYDQRVPVLEYQGRVISEYPLDAASIHHFLTEIGE